MRSPIYLFGVALALQLSHSSAFQLGGVLPKLQRSSISLAKRCSGSPGRVHVPNLRMSGNPGEKGTELMSREERLEKLGDTNAAYMRVNITDAALAFGFVEIRLHAAISCTLHLYLFHFVCRYQPKGSETFLLSHTSTMENQHWRIVC
jgi:hypothetical protein